MRFVKILAQILILTALLNIAAAIAPALHAPGILAAFAILSPAAYLILVVTAVLTMHRSRTLLFLWLALVVLGAWPKPTADWIRLLMPFGIGLAIGSVIHGDASLRTPAAQASSPLSEITYDDEPPARRSIQPLPGTRPERIAYVAPARAPRGATYRHQERGWYDDHY